MSVVCGGPSAYYNEFGKQVTFEWNASVCIYFNTILDHHISRLWHLHVISC